jgi:hypothetical protein
VNQCHTHGSRRRQSALSHLLRPLVTSSHSMAMQTSNFDSCHHWLECGPRSRYRRSDSAGSGSTTRASAESPCYHWHDRDTGHWGHPADALQVERCEPGDCLRVCLPDVGNIDIELAARLALPSPGLPTASYLIPRPIVLELRRRAVSARPSRIRGIRGDSCSRTAAIWQSGAAAWPTYRPCFSSQPRHASATSRQPASMVRE